MLRNNRIQKLFSYLCMQVFKSPVKQGTILKLIVRKGKQTMTKIRSSEASMSLLNQIARGSMEQILNSSQNCRTERVHVISYNGLHFTRKRN